jgi:hypothetical protein
MLLLVLKLVLVLVLVDFSGVQSALLPRTRHRWPVSVSTLQVIPPSFSMRYRPLTKNSATSARNTTNTSDRPIRSKRLRRAGSMLNARFLAKEVGVEGPATQVSAAFPL